MQRFGEKLRTLRKRRGMTMRELAEALDLHSHGSISDFESGRSRPSIELIIKVADLFSVSLDQLLRDEVELE
jgi:transcriptional regulator with XRE-family HTH domain